jgi:quercetin dioxygenase-like cupin family protein
MEYSAEVDGPAELIVSRTGFPRGAESGWHTRPGPTWVITTSGEVTSYQSDGCVAIYAAGSARYEALDAGPRNNRNESNEPVEGVVVALVPLGQPRTIPAPASDATCGR